MSFTTTFLQQCPKCGRRLEVQVRYLGKSVQCPHCRCTFPANDSSTRPDGQADQIEQALREAEIYLASVEQINEVANAWENQQTAVKQRFN